MEAELSEMRASKKPHYYSATRVQATGPPLIIKQFDKAIPKDA
jgi:hypothetical protein